MELAYVAWEPATLYNDIVWLLNQDTCQLRYKSWIISAPFAKQFQKLYKVENLVGLVKQMSISFDLNMEGPGSQADISNQFDSGVRSNQVDDQDENNKNGNASISRSGSEDFVNQEYCKVEEERRKHEQTPS